MFKKAKKWITLFKLADSRFGPEEFGDSSQEQSYQEQSYQVEPSQPVSQPADIEQQPQPQDDSNVAVEGDASWVDSVAIPWFNAYDKGQAEPLSTEIADALLNNYEGANHFYELAQQRYGEETADFVVDMAFESRSDALTQNTEESDEAEGYLSFEEKDIGSKIWQEALNNYDYTKLFNTGRRYVKRHAKDAPIDIEDATQSAVQVALERTFFGKSKFDEEAERNAKRKTEGRADQRAEFFFRFPENIMSNRELASRVNEALEQANLGGLAALMNGDLNDRKSKRKAIDIMSELMLSSEPDAQDGFLSQMYEMASSGDPNLEKRLYNALKQAAMLVVNKLVKDYSEGFGAANFGSFQNSDGENTMSDPEEGSSVSSKDVLQPISEGERHRVSASVMDALTEFSEDGQSPLLSQFADISDNIVNKMREEANDIAQKILDDNSDVVANQRTQRALSSVDETEAFTAAMPEYIKSIITPDNLVDTNKEIAKNLKTLKNLEKNTDGRINRGKLDPSKREEHIKQEGEKLKNSIEKLKSYDYLWKPKEKGGGFFGLLKGGNGFDAQLSNKAYADEYSKIYQQKKNIIDAAKSGQNVQSIAISQGLEPKVVQDTINQVKAYGVDRKGDYIAYMQKVIKDPSGSKTNFAHRLKNVSEFIYGENGIGEHFDPDAMAFWTQLMPNIHASVSGKRKRKYKSRSDNEATWGLNHAENYYNLLNRDLSDDLINRINDHESRKKNKGKTASVNISVVPLFRLLRLAYRLESIKSPYVEDVHRLINQTKVSLGWRQ